MSQMRFGGNDRQTERKKKRRGGGQDIDMLCHAAALKRDAGLFFVIFYFFNRSEPKGYF